MILGETMNSGSHKKDECVSDNTVDVPKTMNVLKKSNRWQAFANAFKVKVMANAINKIFFEKIEEGRLYTYHVLYAIIY